MSTILSSSDKLDVGKSSPDHKIAVGGSHIFLKGGFTKVTLSFGGKEKTMSIQSFQGQFFSLLFQSSSRSIHDILLKISETKDGRTKIKENINTTLRYFGLELSPSGEIINTNESLKLKDVINKKAMSVLDSILYIDGISVEYLEQKSTLLIDSQEVSLTNTQLDIFLYYLSQTLGKDYSTEKQYDAGTIRVHINKINLALKTVSLKIKLTDINASRSSSYILKKIWS